MPSDYGDSCCGGLNSGALKDVQVLILEPVNMLPDMAKGHCRCDYGSQDWQIVLGYPGGPTVITKLTAAGRKGRESETEPATAGVEDGSCQVLLQRRISSTPEDEPRKAGSF